MTVAAALANFVVILTHKDGVWIDAIALAGAVLSAITAALVGVRAYSEFAILARQSRHMLRVLKEASREIERLPIAHPLGRAFSAGRCSRLRPPCWRTPPDGRNCFV